MGEDGKSMMVLHPIGAVNTYGHVLKGSLTFAEGTAPNTNCADDEIGNLAHHAWRRIQYKEAVS
jgi:hypothetical protein